eukprot:5840447-Prymnesium_polylepis.1
MLMVERCPARVQYCRSARANGPRIGRGSQGHGHARSLWHDGVRVATLRGGVVMFKGHNRA